MTTSAACITLRPGSRSSFSATGPARPPTLELSSQTVRGLFIVDHNAARLLPRYRCVGVLELRERTRSQAKVLLDEMALDEQGLLLRDALTKPGDPDLLRGVPLIGRSVRGVVRGTDPFDETARRDEQARRLRERTEVAA